MKSATEGPQIVDGESFYASSPRVIHGSWCLSPSQFRIPDYLQGRAKLSSSDRSCELSQNLGPAALCEALSAWILRTDPAILSTLLHDEPGGMVYLASRDFHKSFLGDVDT
jgi:hypothetical protein